MVNKKQIRDILKAHATIENGKWIFKAVDLAEACMEIEVLYSILADSPNSIKTCPQIAKLNWTDLDGHFVKSFIAKIPGFNSNYCIWVEQSTGITTVSNMERHQSVHNNIDEAKQWCQSDFERKVSALFQS
jgi:hypothetical protein